jgi:benzoylformate decarboxylase
LAGGYAEASGKLAAVNLHVAPGLGNALGMLYDAQKAGAPVLVTAGQHEQGFNVTEPILWADLPTIARPFVKWSTEVHRLADLPRILHRAAKTALAPPTGPVFLSIPGDVLKAEAEIDLGRPTRVAPRTRGDAAAVAAAARLLAAAERPVFIAGDAVARGDAGAELLRLATLLGAPVYVEGIDNSAPVPGSHPLFRGIVTRHAHLIRAALDPHDLLFSVGGDLFPLSLPPGVEPMPPGIKLLHLDSDPWELGKNFAPDAAILGDPKATLAEIETAVLSEMSSGRRAAATERRKAVEAAISADRAALRTKAEAETAKSPIQPLALWLALGELLPGDAVLVEETLSSAGGLRWLAPSGDAQSFFAMRGGGIGWGLPAAIGVKLALPARPVVALIGDGSALYNIQALWTAAHERIPLLFVILNNGSYRILKQRTQALRGHAAQTGRYVGMDLTDPAVDFLALARSFGVAGCRVATLDAFRSAIADALAADAPRLVDVAIDPSFAPL